MNKLTEHVIRKLAISEEAALKLVNGIKTKEGYLKAWDINGELAILEIKKAEREE